MNSSCSTESRTKLPLVSVIIPSYNHVNFVAQAIESVLDQTYPRIEPIVIDDGSTDGTAAVIEGLLRDGCKFRFIRKRNSGLPKSLNMGLREARGELICELASDDFLPVDSVEKRVQFLVEHPDHGAVFGDGTVVDSGGQYVKPLLKARDKQMCLAHYPLVMLLKGARPIVATGLFRRSILLDLGGFDEEFRYYEDLDITIRLAQVTRLGFIDDALIHHRRHGSNTSSMELPGKREKLLLYSKLLAAPALKPHRNMIKKRVAAQSWNISKALCSLSRYREAFSAISNAISHNPWNIKYYLHALFISGNILRNRVRKDRESPK